jgi:hypothetical protein
MHRWGYKYLFCGGLAKLLTCLNSNLMIAFRSCSNPVRGIWLFPWARNFTRIVEQCQWISDFEFTSPNSSFELILLYIKLNFLKIFIWPELINTSHGMGHWASAKFDDWFSTGWFQERIRKCVYKLIASYTIELK